MNELDQIFVTIHRSVVEMLPQPLSTVADLLLPASVVVGFFGLYFAFVTWLERKALARIQNRIGPNRVGPKGLLQPIADAVKMLTKEDIVPRAADRLLHTLAPVLLVVPTLMLFALLPFGKNMIPAALNVGVLMFFALSSISTVATFMAGWGSRNKYSLLGAMRVIAQMISYELPVVMTALPVVMIAGTLALDQIVLAQADYAWFVFTPWGLVGFIAFFIGGMAEAGRSPFDIAEGESEIIAGFHTEYSGFKFALFYLGEYMSAFAFSGLSTAMFLGGWHGPLPSWLNFFLKMFALMCVMIWIRGTFPRLRVDQLMGFSWKFLLPLAFMNMITAGVWFYMPRDTFFQQLVAWLAGAALLVPTFIVLVRVNAGPRLQKRTYKYADL
jgi:NADH-quinone oxidoreductase subunit H